MFKKKNNHVKLILTNYRFLYILQIFIKYIRVEDFLKHGLYLVINVWTTEPKRKLFNQRSSISNHHTMTTQAQSSTLPQSSSTAQKFGNLKTMISEVGLGSHEGKYTPSSSVSNLATR